MVESEPKVTPKKEAPKSSVHPTLQVDIHSRDEQSTPQYYWWIAGGVILLLAIVFFAYPAYKGYQVYTAMQTVPIPEEYLIDMTKLQTDKVAAENTLANTAQTLASTQAKLTEVSTALTLANTERDKEKQTAENTITTLNSNLANAQADVERFKTAASAQDATVADAARRICCVAKVENPSINAFAVFESKITCVSEGGTAITC